MAVPRPDENDISKSLKSIDSTTWLLGSFLLRRSPLPEQTATWADESDNSSYTLTKALDPHHYTTSSLDSPHVKLVYTAGNVSAVWAVGADAFCKVKKIVKGVTQEADTLRFVQSQQPSFNTPQVLYHTTDDTLSYLFVRRLPGRTLDQAWPTLTEQQRAH